MNNLVLLFVLAMLPASFAEATHRLSNNGKEFVAHESRQLINWYNCTMQGNFPDPRTCDHYIACTTALLAYQMPCQMGPNNQRLWYVRDSGPVEQESYCDYREVVQCDLDGEETPAPTSTEPTKITTTTTTTTTTETPETEPTEEPKPTPGNCEDIEAVVGKSCNPMENCKQCGYCDHYVYCDAKSSTWVKKPCAEIVAENGSIAMGDKLFWNQGEAPHGGYCDFFDNLSKDLQNTYKGDPECKPICGYWEDETCDKKYWYTDPNMKDGIWKDAPQAFFCPNGTKWNNGDLTCTFCEGELCNVNC